MEKLNRIKQGMTGQQAADVIYNNDSELLKSIEELKASGGTGNVDVVQTTGDSTTSVISQAGVTKEVNEINGHLENVCGMIDPDYGTVELPVIDVANAEHAVRASQDDEGHVLSEMYSAIQTLTSEVNSLKEQIEKGVNGDILGFADDSSFNPNFPEDRDATVLAVSAGTYVNMLDINGNPIIVEDEDALTVFHKSSNSDYWQYKSIYIKKVIDGGNVSTEFGESKNIDGGTETVVEQ